MLSHSLSRKPSCSSSLSNAPVSRKDHRANASSVSVLCLREPRPRCSYNCIERVFTPNVAIRLFYVVSGLSLGSRTHHTRRMRIPAKVGTTNLPPAQIVRVRSTAFRRSAVSPTAAGLIPEYQPPTLGGNSDTAMSSWPLSFLSDTCEYGTGICAVVEASTEVWFMLPDNDFRTIMTGIRSGHLGYLCFCHQTVFGRCGQNTK